MITVMASSFPKLRSVVLDAPDARALAEFYRQLLGFEYRPGDEPGPGDDDFMMLVSPDGSSRLAFQRVAHLPRSTWPSAEVPQQIHVDLSVKLRAELDVQHDRALALGATLLEDRSGDEVEPLRVYADPAGHPFCIFLVDPADPFA
jgi:catechol 2,3-dioxygenase-like lactoylglutathione lyase family enzyme